jgi:hypothetical protein
MHSEVQGQNDDINVMKEVVVGSGCIKVRWNQKIEGF